MSSSLSHLRSSLREFLPGLAVDVHPDIDKQRQIPSTCQTRPTDTLVQVWTNQGSQEEKVKLQRIPLPSIP